MCTYLAPTLTDKNPLGFMDDLSMRGVRQLDLVDGDDVHGPTTAFQDYGTFDANRAPILRQD